MDKKELSLIIDEFYNLGKQHVENKYSHNFSHAYQIDKEIYPKRKKEILDKFS